MRRFLTTFLPFYFGALGCHLLQSQLSFSPILAASLLGVLITFTPLPPALQLIFCTGTFAGMSSPEVLPTNLELLEVSLIGSVLYALAKPYFTGLGGKLGILAFLTTVAWLFLRLLAWTS